MNDSFASDNDKRNDMEEGNNDFVEHTGTCSEDKKTYKEENEAGEEENAKEVQDSSPQENEKDDEKETHYRQNDRCGQTNDQINENRCNDNNSEDYSRGEDDPPSRRASFSQNDKKTRTRSFGVGMIALVIAVSIAFTTLCGVVGHYAIGSIYALGNILFQLRQDNIDDDNIGDPDVSVDMNVIKNDGSININEQVGSTGYTDGLSIADTVNLVADTVVEITTSQVVTDRFYGQYIKSGAGSGVIISENGFIITNNHVVENARGIVVRMNDGSEFEASVVGTDPSCDIALLKIKASGLTFAAMGSSKNLVVGQEVIAIGNPLGSLGGTVTDGIISALDRRVSIDGTAMTLMQTNAAINPGNSGGGLFDRSGQLIGIVVAKKSDTGIEGLGFAIPIDTAWDAIEGIVGQA